MATQSQLDNALINYQNALNVQQTFTQQKLEWRQKALDCQAARDQYSLWFKKNNACHIDNLNYYYDKWDEFEKKEANQKISVANLKDIYDKVKAEWDYQVEQEIELQESDPEVQQAKIEKQKSSEKNQRMIVISVVVILGIALVVFLWKKLA